MAHPISDIPEILNMVFKRLDSNRDLFRLLTVSRRFFLCVAPLLWESIWGTGILLRLLFPSISPKKKITEAWANTVRELDPQSLQRFNLYAPLVKTLQCHSSYPKDPSWQVILKAVPARPLLPNLEYFDYSDDAQLAPTTRLLEALLCPKLVHILAPGLEYVGEVYSPVFSTQLLAKIAEFCPMVDELSVHPSPIRYAVSGTYAPATPESPLGLKQITSFTQLNKLRTLFAGPETLNPDFLAPLGLLPALKSFVIIIPDDTPALVFPTQFPAPPGCFPSLRHLALSFRSAPQIAQLWRTLPCVQTLVAVTIKVDTAFVTSENDLRDLICAVCQSSPKVTELHLDFSSGASALFQVDLFTPTVINHLKRLPLQRFRIHIPGTLLLPPNDYEQFALALSGVECLGLQECYFTYEGMRYLAKHSPKLQFLCANLEPQSLPPKDHLPLSPTSSPSVLCLRAEFTGSERFYDVSEDIRMNYITSLAAALHHLWPKGVHCELSVFAMDGFHIGERDKKDLELINSAIKELCAPITFDTPDRRSAAQWKYASYNHLGSSLGLGYE